MGGVVEAVTKVVRGAVKAVGSVLGMDAPQMPEYKPPPQVDPASAAAAAAAADMERRRARSASGRASTMLSSGSSDVTTGTKKLLGQ